MMVFALGTVSAQDSAPPLSDSQAPQQPVPAYGQQNEPSPINENPPLSGLDLPSLQEHAAPLSYLQPGATFSESANTNIGNTLGSDFSSITRGLGTLTLRRLWSHYDLALDYMGGVPTTTKAKDRMEATTGSRNRTEDRMEARPAHFAR
jgi:hypothetical protein